MAEIESTDFLIEIEEFKKSVEKKWFIDGDGMGYLATETKILSKGDDDYWVVFPSYFVPKPVGSSGLKLVLKLPKEATHVAWYNK